jgi:phage-related protein
VILAYTHCAVFRQIVDDMGRVAKAAFDTVWNAAKTAFDWISNNWPLLLAIITGPIGLAVYFIAQYWQSIVAGAQAVLNGITGVFAAAGNLLVGAGSAIIGGLGSGMSAAWNTVSGFVTGIPGNIVKGLGDVTNLLYNAGKTIIDSLGRGITDAVTGVYNTVSGIAGKIASLKGPLDADRQLLVPHGLAIMQGLHEGLTTGLADVAALASGVAPTIAATVNMPAAAPVSTGPAVSIAHASFSSDVDVDTFMQRAAWVARTRGL